MIPFKGLLIIQPQCPQVKKVCVRRAKSSLRKPTKCIETPEEGNRFPSQLVWRLSDSLTPTEMMAWPHFVRARGAEQGVGIQDRSCRTQVPTKESQQVLWVFAQSCQGTRGGVRVVSVLTPVHPWLFLTESR